LTLSEGTLAQQGGDHGRRRISKLPALKSLFNPFMTSYAGRPSSAATKRTVKISRPSAISSFVWHPFTSRTFKAQDKPVITYQHR